MSEKSLMTAEKYCLITFSTTHNALKAEKILEDSGLPYLMVPTPREVSAGCGLSVRFFCDDLGSITGTLRKNDITVKDLYRIEKGATGNHISQVTSYNS